LLAGPVNAQTKSDVALMQFHLNSLGYDAGAVDGLWGGTTRGALSQFLSGLGVEFIGVVDDETLQLVAGAYDELPRGAYLNHTTQNDTREAQYYTVFPLKEIACRAVFNAPWVGFENLNEIQEYLARSRCDDIWYQSLHSSLAEAIEGGVKLDIDGDGIRDQLVFLYGFQVDNPLSMVAFKNSYDPRDYLDLDLSERVSPIERIFEPEEVFADGVYPTIQSARFVAVADFNNDGEDDIFISDGGFDVPGNYRSYPSKLLRSSPSGFEVEDVTEPRTSHGAAAGDVNGDGYIDIVLGWGQFWNTPTSVSPDSSRLLLNMQGQGFANATALLPVSLQQRNEEQPTYIALLDVDDDGSLDLISGMFCGRTSKVFWNDGLGRFSDENFTLIPLAYPEPSADCNREAVTNVDQAFLVNEAATGKRYLGVWAHAHRSRSDQSVPSRHLTLHRIDGRILSENVATVPVDDVQAPSGNFVYSMDIQESATGQIMNIFDIPFNRTRLIFDPQTEIYHADIKNHGQNLRWLYDVDTVLNGE